MSPIDITSPKKVNIKALSAPNVVVVAAGNVGPPGPPGQWLALTQAEYDALDPPDPDTLYVIVA